MEAPDKLGFWGKAQAGVGPTVCWGYGHLDRCWAWNEKKRMNVLLTHLSWVCTHFPLCGHRSCQLLIFSPCHHVVLLFSFSFLLHLTGLSEVHPGLEHWANSSQCDKHAHFKTRNDVKVAKARRRTPTLFEAGMNEVFVPPILGCMSGGQYTSGVAKAQWIWGPKKPLSKPFQILHLPKDLPCTCFFNNFICDTRRTLKIILVLIPIPIIYIRIIQN